MKCLQSVINKHKSWSIQCVTQVASYTMVPVRRTFALMNMHVLPYPELVNAMRVNICDWIYWKVTVTSRSCALTICTLNRYIYSYTAENSHIQRHHYSVVTKSFFPVWRSFSRSCNHSPPFLACRRRKPHNSATAGGFMWSFCCSVIRLFCLLAE